jgi:hypothetical protein
MHHDVDKALLEVRRAFPTATASAFHVTELVGHGVRKPSVERELGRLERAGWATDERGVGSTHLWGAMTQPDTSVIPTWWRTASIPARACRLSSALGAVGGGDQRHALLSACR